MKWTIYRQELLLFAPENQLLRYFYDYGQRNSAGTQKDGPGFAIYRKHIEQILRSLRKILQYSTSNGAASNVQLKAERSFEDDGENPPLKAAPEPGHDITLKVPDSSWLNRDAWKNYINYCKETLQREDWLDNTLGEFLEQLTMINDEPMTFSAKLPRQAILSFISVLPILPHWDLPGVFYTQRPHSSLKKMTKLELPFYMATIVYPEKGQDDADVECASRKILGYQVRLEAYFSDLSRKRLSYCGVRTDDYYAYCHNPLASSSSDLAQYRAYGLLIDALQRALGDAAPQLYYVAYPIFTPLGRRHSWHIWLQPDSPSATLEDLRTSWSALQGNIAWPQLHIALAAELEQLDIAYAQGAITQKIEEMIREEAVGVDAEDFVCKYGHLLFPAEMFQTKTKTWTYAPQMFPRTSPKGNQLEIGKEWIERPTLDPRKTNDLLYNATGAGVSLKHSVKLLLNSRYVRLVEQQQDFVQQIVGLKKHQHEKQLEARNAAREQLLDLINRTLPFDDAVLANVRSVLHWEYVLLFDAQNATPVDGQPLTTAGGVARLILGIESNRSLTDSDRTDLLHYLEGGIHVVLSRYLELDPIRAMSHANGGNNTWSVEKTKSFAEAHQSHIDATLTKITELFVDNGSDATRGYTTAVNKYKQEFQALYTCLGQRCSREHVRQLRGNVRKDSPTVVEYVKSITNSTERYKRHTGWNFTHSCLPLTLIFPSWLLQRLCMWSSARLSKIGMFALPWAQRHGLFAVQVDNSAIYRNYLSISFQNNSDAFDPSHIPNIYLEAASHLEKIGGRVFVVVLREGRWQWYRVRQSGMPQLKLIESADVWPAAQIESECYNSIFAESDNLTILLTYDGWYVP